MASEGRKYNATDELIKDLDYTNKQVQELLSEIRNSKVNLAEIKTELKYLLKNVKTISNIVMGDGNNESLATRLALIEQQLEELKKYIDEDSKQGAEIQTKVALVEQKIQQITNIVTEPDKVKEINSAGKWKLYVVIAGGIVTLAGSIIALLANLM